MPFQYYLKELYYRCTVQLAIFLDFTWSQPCCQIAYIKLPSLWPVEHLKNFWKEQKLYYCSGDLQIVTSPGNRFLTFFRNVFLVDSDISVARINHMEITASLSDQPSK